MSDAPDKTFAQPEARRESLFRWLMIGVFGSVVIIYFVAHVFEEPLQADSFTNSHSTSPGGHTALVELLSGEGREITRQSGRIELPEWNYDESDTLVLLEPGPAFVSEYYDEFGSVFDTAMDDEASVVISLPKRTYERAEPQPEGSEELVLYEDLYSVSKVEGVLEETGFDEWFGIMRVDATDVIFQAPYEDPIVYHNDAPTQVLVPLRSEDDLPVDMEILARTSDGDPVIVRYNPGYSEEFGGVILISDPDFLTNRFINREGAGRVAVRVFEYAPPRGKLLINEDIHGFSADASLEYLAFTPPGLWVTLSAIVLLLLFGWRQATVLRPLKAEPQDRRARKYAIEGLARMMERARDHHTAYRRILKRSRLVLGTGHSQVMGAGGGTAQVRKGKTGKITRLPGGSDEERLVNAAQRVAHQMRTGETEHSEYDLD